MKKIFIFLTSFFSGIILFLWVFNKVGWKEIKRSLSLFQGWQGIILLIITLLVILINAIKWQTVLKSLQNPVSFKKAFFSSIGVFSIRYLMPVIGAPEFFQAQSVKGKNVEWKKVFASVLIDRILEITVSFICVIAAILILVFKIGSPISGIIFIFLLALFFLVSLLGFFYSKTLRGQSFIKPILRIFNSRIDKEPYKIEKEILFFLKLKNRNFWKIIFLNTARVITIWIRTLLLINFLGKGFLPLISLIVFSLYFFVSIFPVPAGIGSEDAAQAFIFSLFGLGAGTGTAFVMIIRAVELTVTLFGFSLLVSYGIRLLKKFTKRI